MKYTDAQAQKLRDLYPSASWDDLHEAFPGATKSAIRSAAKYYGVTRDLQVIKPKHDAWQTPDRVKRFYQLLMYADDTARESGQVYDRLAVITEAMEIMRDGVVHG